MTDAVHIKVAKLSQVLDRSITVMNSKYCNGLSNKIMPTEINILNM
jgi:hypothetical protein